MLCFNPKLLYLLSIYTLPKNTFLSVYTNIYKQDGRLRVNDQLIEVNNQMLVGKANIDAMETLRNAMQKESPVPGHIKLVVARRRALPVPDGPPHTLSPADTVDGVDEVGNNNLHSTFKPNNMQANTAPKPLLHRINNDTGKPDKLSPSSRTSKLLNMSSPTIHANRPETVLIEGENYQVQMVGQLTIFILM